MVEQSKHNQPEDDTDRVGDCDPAQIVHYPRYLAHFDACTAALFKTVVYAGAPAANTGFQIVTEQIKR
jgi:acyl-CoA thioesterase FadM